MGRPRKDKSDNADEETLVNDETEAVRTEGKSLNVMGIMKKPKFGPNPETQE